MPKSPTFTQDLLAAFPEREAELRPLIDRAARYGRDCGCPMGAAFLIVSLALAVAYVASAPAAGFGSMLARVVVAVLFVFVASVVGKLLGIAVARFRLARLTRELTQRFAQNER